jgi:hypothetical protein
MTPEQIRDYAVLAMEAYDFLDEDVQGVSLEDLKVNYLKSWKAIVKEGGPACVG